jgi:Ricin-type beta-trefoil lectin domain/Putative Ig domain
VLKRVIVAAAVTVSLLGLSAAAQVPAWAHTRPPPAAHLPGVRVVNLHRAYEANLGHVKPGKIAGIAYARGKAPKPARPNRVNQASCTEPACPVTYNGGPVQHNPHVYLLLWGPNWSTDPSQEASAQYLEYFYGGLGVLAQDDWSTITSQYADGSGHPVFNGSVFAGAFQDVNPPPTGATQTQIAAEADAFATTHALADLTDSQIVVATQEGTCPAGFDGLSTICGTPGTNCGWHSSSNEPYTNLPYLLDAAAAPGTTTQGTACGEDAVNGMTGTNDGFSLVGGDEYADTITNPYPAGSVAPSPSPSPAWVDSSDSVSGGEIADKCLWSAGGYTKDLSLSTPSGPESFAVQSLWSNAAGGCVLTGAVQDKVTITSPGTQSGAEGKAVSLQVHGSSSAGNALTWSATDLPAGLGISSGGLITGTPTTAATYPVTVSATDEAGASSSVSFNWTIKGAGGPVKGYDGLCLDDFGGGTTNGTKADVWQCNNTDSQVWTLNTNKTLSVDSVCLADHGYTGARTKLVLWSCVGNKNEQWTHNSKDEYVLAANGLCLTDPNDSKVNGTQVEIRACRNYKDQHWSLP